MQSQNVLVYGILQSMQDAIVAYIKEKYQPTAIILHGSRARGKERPHSDWDFILLFDGEITTENGRELYQGHNLEFSTHSLPAAYEDIENLFSTKLQLAKVLYEKNGEGTKLLELAAAIYEEGVRWSPERVADHQLWMNGRIDGMRDSIDNPLIFAKFLADFYQRVFNYWYWLIEHTHSQPFYVAIEEVAEKDPEYFKLVSGLADQTTSPQEKVALAEAIRDRLCKVS